jgi:hypothetical protein
MFRFRALLMAWLPMVVLATVQLTLNARAQNQPLLVEDVITWIVSLSLIIVPVTQWIADGHRWAERVLLGLGVTWEVISILLAIQLSSFALGIFAVCLAFSWTLVCVAVAHQMNQSFFDPKMNWFQSQPRPIPGIKAHLRLGETEHPVRVVRLDRNGGFVVQAGPKTAWLSKAEWNTLRKKKQAILDLEVADTGARHAYPAQPVRILDDPAGMGLRFSHLSADDRKALGDLVEELTGRGYL